MTLKNQDHLVARWLLAVLLVWTTASVAWGAKLPARGIPASGTYKQIMKMRAGPFRRSYLVHVPDGYDGRQDLPLLIVLHGAFSTAGKVEKQSGFSLLADRQEFLVVDPNGMGLFGLLRHWNSGHCCGKARKKGIDDVAFVSTVIQEVEQRLRVDKSRIYVAGHSNGGMMAYRFAAERADLVAGIAAVSATIGGRPSKEAPEWRIPPPEAPVSLLAIHGREDAHVPYQGGRGERSHGTIETISVQDSVDLWVRLNECGSTPVPEYLLEDRVARQSWVNCTQQAAVVLYTLEGWVMIGLEGRSLFHYRWMILCETSMLRRSSGISCNSTSAGNEPKEVRQVFFWSKRILLAATILLMFGCASLKPGWTDLAPHPGTGDSSAEAARARALFLDADDHEKLVDAIAAYEAALEHDRENYAVLTGLCEAYILDAAAYAQTKKEKEQRYKSGITYCDRAMYTNPQFRDLVDQGASLADAAHTLTAREADAMMFWVTGVSYYFKECMGGIRRLSSYRLILQTEVLLTRMMDIDPDYSYGVVHFSRGIYYLGLPKFAGGDKELSAELMNRAEEIGPESMLVRWGRAKYYHYETNNREAFERDLHWVLEQDPLQSSTPYPWNVYFQRDATNMLENAERLF